VINENSSIGREAVVGPFAYLRDGAELMAQAFAGKFVEIKKSKIGARSKVPHLSYIGDAIIGEDTNIGAGTITCNYDGIKKHPTKIGDRCFVGSDTMLVAPVELDDDVTTGAGSVITDNVPKGALALARARQRNILGWKRKK
jgi:bifunctional UDP-N-acetylglucosamine pyrophosphorylase/glucosamine-1-phosphate N-acetyltransferase